MAWFVCRRNRCVWPENRQKAAFGDGEGEQSRCDEGQCLIMSRFCRWRRFSSHVNGSPLEAFSGSENRSLLVLWLTFSDFSRVSLVNEGPGRGNIFFGSPDSASAFLINCERTAPPMPATAMPLNTVGPYALISSCVDILPFSAGRSRWENIRNEFMMGAING